MNSQVIEVVHFEEGKQSLVRVPLAGSKLRAILLKSDFHDLMSLGVSTAGWKLYHKQVVVRNNRWYVSVGRMIRNADKNQKVIPKDGNPLNLRRDNLLLAGRAKFRARMKHKRSDVKRNRRGVRPTTSA
jgi:hypothetical protein